MTHHPAASRTKPDEEPRYPMLCEDCGKNYADPPSKLCPGCEAYREHMS